MQRYRVNYRLLIGLVVGSVVLLGGTFALWRFQLDRNAGRLLTRAEEARAEGDLIGSIKLLSQYLGIREDDQEVFSQLANDYADLANSPDVEPKAIRTAFALLEKTVSEQPDNQVIRRRLIDMLLRFRNEKGALDHIDQLLNQNPDDPELEEMRARCLFASNDPKAIDHSLRLIGYDSDADAFDTQKAITPDNPAIYLRVAYAIKSERDEEEFAKRVVEQMVDANPENGVAVLYRAQFRENSGEREEAEADVAQALAISPDDPEVVVANARMAIKEEDYDRATSLLESCLEKHPDNAALYQMLAGIEAQQGDMAAATQRFEEGIKNVDESQTHLLRFYKARLQVQNGDVAEARDTLKDLREAGKLQEQLLDFLEARLFASDNNWHEAAARFERVKPFISKIPDLNQELNLFLALCYEKMAQYDKALASYEITLQADATNKMAAFGRTRMLEALGRQSSGTAAYSIYTALAAELAKDEAEQDWAAFDVLVDQYSDKLDLSEAMRSVLKGEVLMRRGLYSEARAKLIESYKLDPNNLGVRRAAVKLFASDPEQGPIKALKLLDKVVEDLGDMPILRLERADLLVAINDEDLTEQLFALTDGIDDWETKDQVQLWNGLAAKFGRLRDNESRQVCLARVAELSPMDLITLEQMFLSARQGDDQAAMKDVQDRILKVVGSKESSVWMFTEAHRLISLYRTQDRSPEVLEQAMGLVERGLDDRPEWHQLHLLNAEIALLRNDRAGALASFDRASRLGRPSATALFQHVKLLMAQFRYADAIREMEKVNDEIRTQLLGRDYADALLKSGRPEESLMAANAVAELAPNSAQVQVWHGRKLSELADVVAFGMERRQALADEAGAALRKAVELDSSSNEAWAALITYLARRGLQLEANDAVRRAQLSLPEDANAMMFARSYEVLGRAIDAEERYVQALRDADPDRNFATKRMLAEFYIGRSYTRDDKVQKATPLINELLRDVAEGRLDPNDPNARWARSTAARIYASSGQYQHLRMAENLLSSNAVEGNLPAADRLLMAEILSARPEPISRLKAVNLLEGLGRNQKLSLKSELDLANLYFSLGDWRKCREQMTEVIAKYPKNPSVRLSYLKMLLQRGGPNDLNVAVRQLKRLVEIAPEDPATRVIAAQLAMKRGKRKEAVSTTRSMLPKNLATVTKDQVQVISQIAALLVEFEDLDGAEQLYRLAAAKGENLKNVIDLAVFLGRHRSVEQGLNVLDSMPSEVSELVLAQSGLMILREIDESQDGSALEEKIGAWVERGLRKDPDLIPLLLVRAEWFDLQERYEEAADQYRELLLRDDVPLGSRAVVLNNLAYLLALTGKEGDSVSEAKGYINEAVDLLGPRTEVLDTRAVVAISDGRYDDAIRDLELSVIDSPDATKYFHLAVARLEAGQKEKAVEAWQSAVERGLERESVSRLERERFDTVKGELQGLGLISASL